MKSDEHLVCRSGVDAESGVGRSARGGLPRACVDRVRVVESGVGHRTARDLRAGAEVPGVGRRLRRDVADVKP